MTAAVPVRHYLTEIAGDGPRQIGNGRHGDADVQERLDEAHARGVLEARAEAERIRAAARVAREYACAEELEAERTRSPLDEAHRLSDLLGAGLREVETSLSDCVARVLRPVVSASVRRAAVESLAKTLREMLAGGSYARFKVSGPEDLVRALSDTLGTLHDAVQFETSNGVDVVVHADETVLETRIGAWIAALNGDAPPETRGDVPAGGSETETDEGDIGPAGGAA